MKNVLTNDLGDLRKSKMSEMTSEIRCHNHAYQVSLQRQLTHWHKEQVVAVNKLSKMQQTSFQKLIRVENEKRKLQRQARIKRHKDTQRRLREQAERDREDAVRRSLELNLTTKRQTKTRKRANRMVFPLGEIGGEPLMEQEEEDEEETRDISQGEYKVVFTPRSEERETENGLGSPIGSANPNNSNNDLPNIESSLIGSVVDAVFVANQEYIPRYTKPEGTMYLQKVTKLPDIKSHDTEKLSLGSPSQPTQLQMKSIEVLPPITTSAPKTENCKRDSHITETKSSKNEENFRSKRKKERQDLVDDMHKYHIGIANRSFKIPEYDAPLVTSVKKYHMTSDGSFTSTEVSVRPAMEDFKLPSRKPYYLVSKALVWEKQREADRERKVRQFINRQKEIEDEANQTPERDETPSTPELPSNSYQRTRRQSTYITLNDSIHHKALLGVVGDKDDLRNCRYLRLQDSKRTEKHQEDKSEDGLSRTFSPTKRREKLSSWGKLSSVKASPTTKDQYYYVSML